MLSVCVHVVYVDSGSTDDSVAVSRSLGVASVELASSSAFTAARARNEGFELLLDRHPKLEYVFFVDGDCEVQSDWLPTAERFMIGRPDVAVVWGRRRERFRDKSAYNLLCDIEWDDAPLGEVKFCGGDAMMRVQAFRSAQGFRPDLICGEEPELCVRLRARGWRIWHVADAMTTHDASIYRFHQWWTRMRRGGYAFAQGVALHGGPPEYHWVAETRKIWLWGFVIPATLCLSVLMVGAPALGLLIIYPVQILRLAARGRRSTRENWLRALALVVCKYPEFLGQLQFFAARWLGRTSNLIEYK